MSFSREDLIGDIVIDSSEYFLNKKGIVGLGVGNKISNGLNTGEVCLTVFVEKKLSLDELNKENVIPKTYLGMKTDIIQIGRVETLGYASKVRPIMYGSSISPATEKLAGTAGCLVYDKKGHYILTNNHVIAGNNKNLPGTPILQPSLGYGGDINNDVVAHLDRFIPVKFYAGSSFDNTNYVDAAIAKIVSKNITTKLIYEIGPLKGVTDPVLNGAVQFAGEKSGYVKSKITNIASSFSVDFSGKRCIF
ncbi:MAG: hypothetical protein ACRC7R_01045, partial [Sarcina sp.]